jgi:hypothetical protein
MSIIRQIQIALSDIIKESNLVLEVRCIEPYTEELAVNDSNSGALVKPFIKHGYTFSVINVLKNTAAIEVPSVIRVPKEEWRRFLSQHKEHYANGPGKSYGVKQYLTGVDSMKKADILFLDHFQGVYELTAQDAFESVAAREVIEKLIAAD